MDGAADKADANIEKAKRVNLNVSLFSWPNDKGKHGAKDGGISVASNIERGENSKLGGADCFHSRAQALVLSPEPEGYVQCIVKP